MQRANEALVVAAVAERAPCRADAGAQRRLRNDAALPDRVEQLVLADRSITVANEIDKQVEHLRFDVNDRAGAPQLLPRHIDLEFGEAKIQSSPSSSRIRFATAAILSNSRRLSERCTPLWEGL